MYMDMDIYIYIGACKDAAPRLSASGATVVNGAALYIYDTYVYIFIYIYIHTYLQTYVYPTPSERTRYKRGEWSSSVDR